MCEFKSVYNIAVVVIFVVQFRKYQLAQFTHKSYTLTFLTIKLYSNQKWKYLTGD